MAQGAVVTPVNGLQRKDEKWEISEYEKILRFRDQVLSGTHPRVKVPQHLVGKLNSSPRTVSSPSKPTPRSTTSQQAQSTPIVSASSRDGINSRDPKNTPETQRTNASRSAASTVPNVSKSTTELDPIFLHKSEELVKAEIQLQRQRLERGLRDQIDQRKNAAKLAPQTSESLPDFDLSDVLSKALELMQPAAAADVEYPAPRPASDDDSFDENTFYSSQHDTPDNRSPASQDHREPGEVEILDTVMVDQPSPLAHTGSAYPRPPAVPIGPSQVQSKALNAIRPNSPRSNTFQPRNSRYNFRDTTRNAVSTAGEKFDEPVILEDASTSAKDSSNTSPTNNSNDPAQDSTDSNAAQQSNRRPNNTARDPIPDPIIRATHDLSPVAPQAARVSPLINPRTPAVNQQNFRERAQPGPASASQNVSAVSSPEGAKGMRAKKRNEKKKKDKGRKNASKQAASPVPYIKPEPRSPSPFEPLSRPLKRQRQSFQNADGLDYDEPRRDRQEELPAVSYDDSLAPRSRARSRSGYEIEPRSYSPRPIRRERDDVDYRRIASVQHARRPLSPAQYPLPYSPTEARPVRASSQAMFERPAREPVRYYREEQIPRREIVDLDRERSRSPVLRERAPLPMAPPRPAPERIVVDAHGRRYYAPVAEEKYYPIAAPRYSVAPPARSREAIRYSVAPPARGSEPEIIYERAPLRPAPEIITDDYEDRRVVYRRPVSPQFAVPPVRRVISQAEREGTVDLRAYREREYSTRPVAMAPPDEYIQIRGAPERRQLSHYPEATREYVSRASMHPEPIRYEIPREYVGRLQSVRPEALGREFTSSIRPEPRREILREASVRPGEPVVRREYAAPPRADGERYDGEPIVRREYAAPPRADGERYDGEPAVRREYAAPPRVDSERYEFARPLRRAAEEPIYIDGPREGVPEALPEDSRREVYR